MALKYATERIKSLVDLVYGDYSSSSRLGDRLGFKQAAYILLSYLIYNKNIVIDDPPKAIVVFIDMILTKAPAFRKLHNSLRYDIQAAYYAPKLLDALIRIMPGFIEFDKEERDALVEEGKRLQAAIKAGSAVSEAKVMNITKHIQTLNEAEKNGGIVAAHNPNPIDTMKYFNAECVYMRHTWQTTWGRLLTSIDAKNISTIKRASISALNESSIETDCFSSNNNICAVLSPLNITLNNLTDKKIIVLIDAPRDASSEQYIKNLMATVTLSLFKLINNGINIIVIFSTMQGTMTTNDELLPTIENIIKLYDFIGGEPYYFTRRDSPTKLANTFINNIGDISNVEELSDVVDNDTRKVIISFKDKHSTTPLNTPDGIVATSKINNLYKIVIDTDSIKSIKELLENEAWK